jgi:hypothetical protein
MQVWTPRIVYNAITVDLSYPMELWLPVSGGVGGSARVASGAGEAYELRRDQMVDLGVRFDETEWPVVEAWLRWMQQTFGSCQFYFDRFNLPGANFTADLETPKLGEEIKPTRDTQYPAAMTIPVRLRQVGVGGPISVAAYP